MNLPVNFEKTILEKCGWSDKQSLFYGTLIYNITNSQSETIADIVCTRNIQGIKIDWIIAHQEDHNIYFSYLKNTNSIDKHHTSFDISTQNDISVLLDIIQSTIKNQKGNFYPKEKNILNFTNKI